VGLTVEFLVGFRAIESKISGQIDYLLSSGKKGYREFGSSSVGQGEKEKLGVVLLQVFDRRIGKGKRASSSPNLGYAVFHCFPVQGTGSYCLKGASRMIKEKRHELSSRISGSTDYTNFHRFELLLVILKQTDPPEGKFRGVFE